jgi:hypothetical protein
MKANPMIRSAVIAAGVCASLLATTANAAGYYYRQSTAAVYMVNGNTDYLVLSANVPAGTWVINTFANPVNFDAVDISRCRIWVNGAPLSFSSTMLGGGNNFPATAVLTNSAVVTVGSKQLVQLKCGHDAAVPGQRIDPGAQLVITRAPGT